MKRVIPPIWDVVVVGAGLGGAVAAWQLAQSGLSVLVLEAGPATVAPPGSRRAGSLLRRLGVQRRGGTEAGYLRYHALDPSSDARPWRVETRLGRGLGGTSAIYEAALGRLRRSDFAGGAPDTHPDTHPFPAAAADGPAGPGGEAPLPGGWPIDYDAFRVDYARAEALMGVRGGRDPLDPDDAGAAAAALGVPPPLTEMDEALRDRLVANGLHPFRLRVGFDYVPGCDECIGRRCPRACRADGFSRALGAALATGRVQIETGITVTSLQRQRHGIRLMVRGPGERSGERAGRRVVLAAGALATPLVLARSRRLWEAAGPPPMLGRGLMFHISDKFAVFAPHSRRAGGPRKALAFRDHYGGAARLGEIQSTGGRLSTGLVMSVLRERVGRTASPWPRRLVEVLRPLAWVAARLAGPAPVLSTISEDLPYASNRVWEEEPGDGWPGEAGSRIVVAYRPDPALVERLGRARALIRAAFAPYSVAFLHRRGQPNWGHPMGTCRMGTDPALSVVSPEGNLWDHPDIYVADASVFPTSGGVGPSLTIVAHALRVADRIAAAAADAGEAAAAPGAARVAERVAERVAAGTAGRVAAGRMPEPARGAGRIVAGNGGGNGAGSGGGSERGAAAPPDMPAGADTSLHALAGLGTAPGPAGDPGAAPAQERRAAPR